jgi:hypothetical protein
MNLDYKNLNAKGIYGVMDLKVNKIVYVGMNTHRSFGGYNKSAKKPDGSLY